MKPFYEYKKDMNNFNPFNYQVMISHNIKRIRTNLYDNTINYYSSNKSTNPYTIDSVSKLLGINKDYYIRIENFDKTKPISLNNLIKLSIIFNIPIEDFFKYEDIDIKPQNNNDIENKLNSFNYNNYKETICNNIKRLRRKTYKENKSYYKEQGIINPFTVEHLAELIDISTEHLKLMEGNKDNKHVSLNLIIKLSIIFECDINEFFKD